MHMYYWEDPGSKGYDYVALADCEANARSRAMNAYDGPPESKGDVIEGLQRRPTGIFHYNAAIEIFTECDPELSLASHQEWDALRNIAAAALAFVDKHEADYRDCVASQSMDLDVEFMDLARLVLANKKCASRKKTVTESLTAKPQTIEKAVD